jgi:hypothetical protein
MEKLKWLGEPATTHGEPPFMFFYCSLAIKTCLFTLRMPLSSLIAGYPSLFLTAIAIHNAPALINLAFTPGYIKPLITIRF